MQPRGIAIYNALSLHKINTTVARPGRYMSHQSTFTSAVSTANQHVFYQHQAIQVADEDNCHFFPVCHHVITAAVLINVGVSTMAHRGCITSLYTLSCSITETLYVLYSKLYHKSVHAQCSMGHGNVHNSNYSQSRLHPRAGQAGPSGG